MRFSCRSVVTKRRVLQHSVSNVLNIYSLLVKSFKYSSWSTVVPGSPGPGVAVPTDGTVAPHPEVGLPVTAPVGRPGAGGRVSKGFVEGKAFKAAFLFFNKEGSIERNPNTGFGILTL